MADFNDYSLQTENELETEQFACRLGKQLRGGEVIELIGDVGAGKTTFVRGLARGIDSLDVVSSPTFTISNIYKGRVVMCHYDLYRLNSDVLIRNELAEMASERQAVLVLEWAQEVNGVLPDNRLTIELKPNSDKGRQLKVKIPSAYNHLEIK